MDANYYEYIVNRFMELGLLEYEAKYCKNKLVNAIRKTKDRCIDNIRLAVDKKGYSDYIKAKNNGCCGFYDEVLTLNSGKKVYIGFNYGH